MCRVLKINKTRTTYYYKYYSQSDAIIERLNRTIKDMLSKYINSSISRNCVCESTGITPCKMFFGEEYHIMEGAHHIMIKAHHIITR